MADWKKLSESAEKRRAATFEAQMLAMLAKDKPVSAETPVTPARDGIQITVTASGHTTRYENLEAVPAIVRQQIVNVWRPDSPPVIHVPETVATRKPRSRRVAMGLNLVIPGAGQFYLGQPVAGSLYAFGFIACFVAILVIFLRGYGDYVQRSTGDEIFEPGNLERLTQSFHTGWLGGLQVVAILIYIASAIHLSRSRPR